MNQVYVNLKEHENLAYVIDYFKNKDLVSVEDIIYALDEALEDIERTNREIEEEKERNEQDFYDDTILREKGLL